LRNFVYPIILIAMPFFPSLIKSKLPKTGTTIFTAMSELANAHNAINLAQGFPNFECDASLIDLVGYYMRKGLNQYAPMQGILPLREAIASKISSMYGADYDPDKEITITAGATQAIYTAITAIIKEGDEVIVFEPAYDSYVPAIELNGGIPVYIQLKAPDYRIDWSEVKKRINHRTRMIMLNTPHNPTGTILSAADMQQLEKLTKNTEIILLSDEVYEHIIFDSFEHQSVTRYPGLSERSLVVFSFGKTFHTTGWKVGYCLGPANLMAEFRKIHQFTVFSVNTPIQYALAEFITRRDIFLELSSFYTQKRDHFLNLLKGSKFKAIASSGSYFQLLNYSKITSDGDMDFAKRLTTEIGVAAVPTSVFYHKPIDCKTLRFCFAKDDETLEKAAEKLCSL
jgi:methionine aminotransferase